MIVIESSSIVLRVTCTSPILPFFSLLGIFMVLMALHFSECHIVVYIHYVAFISEDLSHCIMHLKFQFLPGFVWLDSSFIFYGLIVCHCTDVPHFFFLSIHLLKDILVVSKA